jgi:hypothetical protein
MDVRSIISRGLGCVALGAAAAVAFAPAAAFAAPSVTAAVNGTSVTVSASGCTSGGSIWYQWGSNQGQSSSQRTFTGASGAATFAGLQPGTYTAAASCNGSAGPDYGSAQFTIGPNGGADTGDGTTAGTPPHPGPLLAAGITLLGVASAGGLVLLRRRTSARA